MRLGDTIRAYARVCRVEYVQLEGPGILVPLFLAASSVDQILSIHVAEALAVAALWFFSGFMTNSLTDVEVDSLFKTHIADAVHALGKGTLIGLIVAHVALALLLTVHLAVVFADPRLVFWVTVALFFGLAYSVKPFHFKVRGALYFSLMIGSFIIVSLVYYVIGGIPNLQVGLVFASFLVAQQGIELVNQAQDYLEDKQTGLRTPAVRWGVRPTLIAALLVTAAGVLSGMIAFHLLFRDLPDAVLFGARLSSAVLSGATILILAATYAYPLIGIWRFMAMARQDRPLDETITEIKAELDYPRWQVCGILGATSIATLYFLWKLGTGS